MFQSVFIKKHKKVNYHQKQSKWRFWWLIAFLNATIRTFVCLLFLKLNESQNMKNKFVCGGFLQKPKHGFLGVQNSSFKNSNFKFVFLCLFFDVKRSFMPIFTKNINIEAPWNFLKMINTALATTISCHRNWT